jgi:hypothetical protein
LSALIHRAGGVWSARQAAIADGIDVNGALEPGWPVKLPVRGSYRSPRDRAASRTGRVESHTDVRHHAASRTGRMQRSTETSDVAE